jgi:spermidine synthase
MIAVVPRLALLALLLAAPKVLVDAPSEFNGRVIVTERGSERTLRFSADGAPQSVVRVGDPRTLALTYTRSAMVALGLVPRPRRILIVGLGGGAMAMFLRAQLPEARIDGVDIDPVVVSVARQHLGLVTDEKLTAAVADGRKFLEASAGGYNLIFLDAYDDEDPPEHLLTAEFLSLVRSRLSPGGVAVANLGSPSVNTRFADMTRTWSATFDALCVLAVPSGDNTILLARGDGQPVTDLTQRAAAFARGRTLTFDLPALAKGGCRAAPSGGEVIRDAR